MFKYGIKGKINIMYSVYNMSQGKYVFVYSKVFWVFGKVPKSEVNWSLLCKTTLNR